LDSVLCGNDLFGGQNRRGPHPMITPQKVEARLYELSKEIEQCHEDLVNAENSYHTSKAKYEIAMARSRINLAEAKLTAQGREDTALLENQSLHLDLAGIEARVKSTRALANKLRTQVDIARTISVSVRTEMNA